MFKVQALFWKDLTLSRTSSDVGGGQGPAEGPGALLDVQRAVEGLDRRLAGQALTAAADLHDPHVVPLAEHGGRGDDVRVGAVAPHGGHAEHLKREGGREEVTSFTSAPHGGHAEHLQRTFRTPAKGRRP